MRRLVCLAVAAIVCLLVVDAASAQFDRGGFDRSRFGGSGGGPPSFGRPPGFGGGPPGFGRPPSGFDPSRFGRGDSDRDRGRDDRNDDRGRGDDRGRSDDRRSSSRDDSRGRSGSKSQPRWTPPQRVRVTVDLPSAWAEADLNHDGQIGLYEWDRAKYTEFFALDVNRDGLLTPQEIARSGASTPSAAAQLPTAQASTGTVMAATSSGRPAALPTSRSSSSPASAPAASGAPITAVEFDAESQEGRWAKFVFGRLDRDKDGSISQEEWSQSQSTRLSFEKRNVKVSFPASFEQFGGLIVAVQRADKNK